MIKYVNNLFRCVFRELCHSGPDPESRKERGLDTGFPFHFGRIQVFRYRVKIYNPGGLPKGLPEKDFGRRSVCRNPNIASLLLRCDYIEKMGSGIERIHAAIVKENCPSVKIRFDIMFTFPGIVGHQIHVFCK